MISYGQACRYMKSLDYRRRICHQMAHLEDNLVLYMKMTKRERIGNYKVWIEDNQLRYSVLEPVSLNQLAFEEFKDFLEGPDEEKAESRQKKLEL